MSGFSFVGEISGGMVPPPGILTTHKSHSHLCKEDGYNVIMTACMYNNLGRVRELTHGVRLLL